MIRVILWDVDATLLDFKAAEKAAILSCFEKFRMGSCSDEMITEYSAINDRYWKALERGEITKPEVLEGRFREFFSLHGLDTGLASAFNQEYQIRLGDTVVFFDGAYELVSGYKGKYVQCVVTNGTKIAQANKLRNSGLDQLIDEAFISDEIGVEKPGIGFFLKVFDRLSRYGDFKKDEILIVGDSLTSDMQGGNNAGIVCCWYNPNKKENTLGIKIDYEIDNLWQLEEILAAVR